MWLPERPWVGPMERPLGEFSEPEVVVPLRPTFASFTRRLRGRRRECVCGVRSGGEVS